MEMTPEELDRMIKDRQELREALASLEPILQKIREDKAMIAKEKEENAEMRKALERKAMMLEQQNVAHQKAREANLQAHNEHYGTVLPAIHRLIGELRELAGIPDENKK